MSKRKREGEQKEEKKELINIFTQDLSKRGFDIVVRFDDGRPAMAVYKGFFDAKECKAYREAGLKYPHWNQEFLPTVQKFQPRLTLAFAHDKTFVYRYSRLTIKPVPFEPEVTQMMDKIKGAIGMPKEQMLGTYVLGNQERDNKDHHSEHADDEADIDQSKGIWSMNFGSTRAFVIRKKKQKKEPKRRKIDPEAGESKDAKKANKRKPRKRVADIILREGDVLYMYPGAQQVFTHQVPRPTKKQAVEWAKTDPCVQRINYTVRSVLPSPLRS